MADHVVTVAACAPDDVDGYKANPFGAFWRATCECGWRSATVIGKSRAQVRAAEHAAPMPDCDTDTAVAEAWRDGYDAALTLVRAAASRFGSLAIEGIAQSIDNVRDDMQEKWEATNA